MGAKETIVKNADGIELRVDLLSDGAPVTAEFDCLDDRGARKMSLVVKTRATGDVVLDIDDYEMYVLLSFLQDCVREHQLSYPNCLTPHWRFRDGMWRMLGGDE